MENTTISQIQYHPNELVAETDTTRQQDELSNLRELIQSKNSVLYELQMKVLRKAHAGEARSECHEDLSKQCEAMEKEISELVVRLKSVKRAQTNRSNQRKAEIHADAMLRELKANIARGDFKQYKVWQEAQEKELQVLQTKLEEARSRGRGMEEVVARLEACHTELEHMVKHFEAGAGVALESDTDSELEYEQVEELEMGDRVKLVCDDEDGFVRGEEGVIVEVDPSVAYPFRVKSLVKAANGYFKACDLQLVQRHFQRHCMGSDISQPPCPVSKENQHRSVSPYVKHATDSYHNVDLEKGLCKTSLPSKQHNVIADAANFLRNPCQFALTLNPLAVV